MLPIQTLSSSALPFSDCLSISSIKLDIDGKDGLGGVFRSILRYDCESTEPCRILCGNESDFGDNTAAIVKVPGQVSG